MDMNTEPLLAVKDLSIAFAAGRQVLAVDRISFSIKKGETLALVGESGSGKSATALSIMKLLPYPAASHPSGQVMFKGQDLLGLSERDIREIRGADITIIFQEPMTSLNPLHTIEQQIGEILLLHRGLTGKPARARILELLNQVGIPNPETRLKSYPHQMSGGQRQRVMIAMALANEPDLLIADEPTTALDVTIQAQVLELLFDLRERLGMAMLLITHDLGVVRKMADRVCVMNDGEVVEAGAADDVFERPTHDYTKKLLGAVPKGRPLPAPGQHSTLVATEDLKVWYPIKRWFGAPKDFVKAVDGVSIAVPRGHTLGVVGESGSGKTTLGLALLRIARSEGAIAFDGERIDTRNTKAMRPRRRRMQIVFQDPFASLSPKMSVRQIVGEGLPIHRPELSRDERSDEVARILDEVGLGPAVLDRYPHEFSGGQRQRIAIARAMIVKPDLVVLDEPTSALDMSVQGQIIELLRELQERHGLTYVFISHDLKVVRALAHELLVLKGGRVVEQGPADKLFDAPQCEYTRELISASLEFAMPGAT